MISAHIHSVGKAGVWKDTAKIDAAEIHSQPVNIVSAQKCVPACSQNVSASLPV